MPTTIAGSSLSYGSEGSTSYWGELAQLGYNIGSEYLTQGNAKDPERYAKSQGWFQAAVNGDAVALCFLKYMGGGRGCAPNEGCGGAAACGFATPEAKAYNEVLYQTALQVLAGTRSPSSPILPAPSAGSAIPQAQPFIEGVQRTRQQELLGTVTSWAPTVLLLTGVAVIAWLVMRARR